MDKISSVRINKEKSKQARKKKVNRLNTHTHTQNNTNLWAKFNQHQSVHNFLGAVRDLKQCLIFQSSWRLKASTPDGRLISLLKSSLSQLCHEGTKDQWQVALCPGNSLKPQLYPLLPAAFLAKTYSDEGEGLMEGDGHQAESFLSLSQLQGLSY